MSSWAARCRVLWPNMPDEVPRDFMHRAMHAAPGLPERVPQDDGFFAIWAG